MSEFEFEIGERVGIIRGVFQGHVGTILSKESFLANGTPIKSKYNVEVIVGEFGERYIVSKDETSLVSEKVFNSCDTDCDCCGCNDCNYENNKEAENLDNDKKFNLGDLYDPDEDEKEMIEEIAYDRYIQYESRKLAWEKYKVPMGWKE